MRDRQSYAFALVSVAAGLTIENGLITKAVVALGGVAHKPWRNATLEQQLLVGKPANRDTYHTFQLALLALRRVRLQAETCAGYRGSCVGTGST